MSKLAKQKIKIYDDLLILKHREEKENIKCLFKRRFCKIDYSRFRWNKKKSDDFHKQIRSFPTDYSVSECVDNKNEDDQERPEESSEEKKCSHFHMCEKCDKMFENKHDMENGKVTNHLKSLMCEECDYKFSKEINIGKHIEN